MKKIIYASMLFISSSAFASGLLTEAECLEKMLEVRTPLVQTLANISGDVSVAAAEKADDADDETTKLLMYVSAANLSGRTDQALESLEKSIETICAKVGRAKRLIDSQ